MSMKRIWPYTLEELRQMFKTAWIEAGKQWDEEHGRNLRAGQPRPCPVSLSAEPPPPKYPPGFIL
jgi:hypothetical protein